MFPVFLCAMTLSKHVLSRVGQGFTHISVFVITASGVWDQEKYTINVLIQLCL